MKNLWHKIPRKYQKYAVCVFLVVLTLSILYILIYDKQTSSNTPPKPGQTAQSAKIAQHNRNIKIKRFPDLKPSSNEICRAFGQENKNRATYFECYTYNQSTNTWHFHSRYGYFPDYIRQ
jgi:hypothetical protein